ncbi:MAG: hypothetical protein JNN06_07325 [Gemmobacter sp.]|uniref:hypothetical protein n=1 Tax=Gemmobacter sp. TaxID=1898957 RepID=UPI001A61C20A|nr:hypothetical protein [Gemmobacter sp.]MBL8562077.1 hypothetical protein [Gemmobacter sp.]
MAHDPKTPAQQDPASLRQVAPNVIDQRQQQIDPAGQHRRDPDARPDTNTKQPGNLPPARP